MRLCKVRKLHTFPKNISCFRIHRRRLQCNIFLASKTSSRFLQDVFTRRLPKTSSSYICKTSSRCLQEVFRETSCKHVLKTSWKRKSCYAEDDFRTSWRRFQQVFNTSSPRQMFAGLYWQFRCDIRGERQR